jgi:hypothetical protein
MREEIFVDRISNSVVDLFPKSSKEEVSHVRQRGSEKAERRHVV